MTITQLLTMALHALQSPTFTTPEARADLAGKIESALAAVPAAPQVAAAPPIPMVLHCPKCGLQHVDAEEWEDDPHDIEQGQIRTWKNEPHRSHLCHGCGHIWRPADVPTTGVQAVKTTGKADSPLAAAPEVATPHPADVELLERASMDFEEGGDTDVDYETLLRFCDLGWMEANKFCLLPAGHRLIADRAAQAACDTGRAA